MSAAVTNPIIVPSAQTAPAGPRRFRPDIQGLRAIAVTLVVLYHADVPGIRGGYVGVDVFFVISGFLITGQLLREVEREGRISFMKFYANRLRRLVPPAAFVLLVTLLVARVFGSLFQFKASALDAIFTVGYLFNYRLAALGVDYQNANGLESPFQHFWSLAVEEQFYFVWPVLMMGCVWAARRRRIEVITGLLAVIFVASLYFSVTVTESNAPLAYFSLHTRAWELAAGALIAIGATRLSRQPRWAVIAESWAGVGLIVVTGVLYTDATAFPGSAALLPTFGAAMVIAAGCRQVGGSAEVVLNRRPMQGVGAVSYSWYLWHWPMLMLVPFMFGHSFAWWENVELMIIALWMSVLSFWIIENPTRRTQLRLKLWTGVGLGLSTSVAALAALLLITMPALVGEGSATLAVSLSGDAVNQVQRAVGKATQTKAVPSNLTPSLEDAAKDQPVTSRNGCHLGFTQTVQPDCVYGDHSGRRVAVVVGDSHAQQWLPGLDKAAKDNHWRLIAWTKAACPLADIPVFSTTLKREFTECLTWRKAIIDRISLLAPDLVIVSQSDTVAGTSVQNTDWAEQTIASLAKFQKVKIPIAYISDTPYHDVNVPECVARNLGDVGACTINRDRSQPYHGRSQQLRETLGHANMAVIDPTDWFCTQTDCPAVVGNLLVYRDQSHVSTAYAYYLAPLFNNLFTK